jgi:hypothetical protein
VSALSMCQALDGWDDAAEMSGLEPDDIMDGIRGMDWITVPPPKSWFQDKKE